jgi:adenylate kinase
MKVVLLGPPASGKGTQGRELAKALSVPYLSTGALLREQVENSTELGRKAKPILDEGQYLPDALMFPIVADWLRGRKDGWVLDGFPRSLAQAGFLDGWLEAKNGKLDAALLLDVPFDVLRERIFGRMECPECRWSGQRDLLPDSLACPVCGHRTAPRADDSLENFTSRFREFEQWTLPVARFYQDKGILKKIDATAERETVAARILEILP